MSKIVINSNKEAEKSQCLCQRGFSQVLCDLKRLNVTMET